MKGTDDHAEAGVLVAILQPQPFSSRRCKPLKLYQGFAKVLGEVSYNAEIPVFRWRGTYTDLETF